MTRAEAIKILNASDYFWLRPTEDEFDALNMAINALEDEPCKDCPWRRQGIDRVYKSATAAFTVFKGE